MAATASLAGCTGLSDNEANSTLDLTVQNDGADPVSVQIDVVDDEGTAYKDESDQIDSGVARAFEVTVGTTGRHEVIVTGDGWRGQLAWDADACVLYDARVGVNDESVEVAGECMQQR